MLVFNLTDLKICFPGWL